MARQLPRRGLIAANDSPSHRFDSLLVAAGLAVAATFTTPLHAQPAGPPPPAEPGSPVRVHDPVVIRVRGDAAGDDADDPAGSGYVLFHTGRGIQVKRSPDLRAWRDAGRVFETNPAWIQEAVPGAWSLWAPDIVEFGGRYHLYYSASTFGKNLSAIGHATAKTLDPASPDYGWEDHGPVVRSGPGDDFNAIDPHVVLDAGEEPWMSFGSFWGGLQLIKLDRATGGRDAAVEQIAIAARPAGERAIEAPTIVRRDGWFYLFASVDFCCRGVESTYKIVVGRARDIGGPYEDREGRAMLEGGGTLVLEGYDYVRGPGHNDVLIEPAADDAAARDVGAGRGETDTRADTGEVREGDRAWLVHHYYDARHRGRSALQIRPLTWDADGWPVAGEPLEDVVTATAAGNATR